MIYILHYPKEGIYHNSHSSFGPRWSVLGVRSLVLDDVFGLYSRFTGLMTGIWSLSGFLCLACWCDLYVSTQASKLYQGSFQELGV